MTNTLQLKALLVSQGLTQKDLARQLEISQQSVNAKLNNKRTFKLSEIVKICGLLKIDAKECFVIFFADEVDLRLQNV